MYIYYLSIYKLHTSTTEHLIFSFRIAVDFTAQPLRYMHPTLETTATGKVQFQVHYSKPLKFYT